NAPRHDRQRLLCRVFLLFARPVVRLDPRLPPAVRPSELALGKTAPIVQFVPDQNIVRDWQLIGKVVAPPNAEPSRQVGNPPNVRGCVIPIPATVKLLFALPQRLLVRADP